MYGWQDGSAVIAFRANDRRVRFMLPLPDRNAKEFTHHDRGPRQFEAAERLYEQAIRQRWRALALVIKAKLEAVEAGISEFEDEFLGVRDRSATAARPRRGAGPEGRWPDRRNKRRGRPTGAILGSQHHDG
jgi:hypothetical protein